MIKIKTELDYIDVYADDISKALTKLNRIINRQFISNKNIKQIDTHTDVIGIHLRMWYVKVIEVRNKEQLVPGRPELGTG